MKRLPGNKDVDIPLSNGALDVRTPAGEANITDFRLLLNTSTWDEKGRSRLPGWKARRTTAPSNEDLHDQLLGAIAGATQREPITLLAEVTSSTRTPYSIAATRSRIYAATGKGRNWRVLAYGLGGPNNDDVWSTAQLRMAQMGDYLLFTNGLDPILAWPLGGGPVTDDSEHWSAFEVYDLQGLGITRASVVAAWGGFAFLADITVDGDAYPGRVYWSDYDRPLEWAPGGESSAGYVDLGRGERVLAILPISGALRCYTDKAIYSVELVGGDAVFTFREIYRGDLALAYRNGIVNMGDNHLWLTRNTLVTAGQYDRIPKMFDWLHKASGAIFNGITAETLNALPASFTAFGPLNNALCHQIASGWDGVLENAWFSWPTTTADANDPAAQARRMTLVVNPRYNKTTLVDHGFSAFAPMRRPQLETIRDFLLEYTGVTDVESLLVELEGMPFNTHTSEATASIWNANEDPGTAKDEDSICNFVQDRYLSLECSACEGPPYFCMASATDYSIKEFDPAIRYRETYLASLDTQETFPNTSEGSYSLDGYATVIQGEVSKHGTLSEKTVTRIGLSMDATPETPAGKVYVQLGVTNSPHCVDWRDSHATTIDCLRGGAPRSEETTLRAAKPASFPFYRAGGWLAYRICVTDAEDDFSPTGITVTFNELTLSARVKAETWTNQ